MPPWTSVLILFLLLSCGGLTLSIDMFEFLIDAFKEFGIKFPKIFLNDVALGKKLQRYVQEKHYQSIIRVGFDSSLFEKVVVASGDKREFLIIANHQQIATVLEKAFQMTFLQHPGILLLISLDRVSDFKFTDGYETLSTIILAYFDKHLTDTLIQLRVLKYNYQIRQSEFDYLGYWHPNKGFNTKEIFHPNDFQNATLTILCKEYTSCLEKDVKINGEVEINGYAWDVINLLGQTLKFKFNWTLSPQNDYEVVLPNGSSYGVVKDFTVQGYDVLLGCMLSNVRRWINLDLTHPFIQERFGFVAHYPTADENNTWIFTKQLFKAKTLWIAFAIVLAVIVFCIILMIKFAKHNQNVNWMLLLLLVSLNQGLFHSSYRKFTSWLIVIFASSVFFWMLTTYYCVFMTSLLAVSSSHLLVSVSEVIHSHYDIIIRKETPSLNLYQMTGVPKNVDRNIFFLYQQHAFDTLCHQKNFAYLVGFNQAKEVLKLRKSSCSAYFVNDILYREYFHFITPKGRIFNERLTLGILRLREYGIISRLLKIHDLSSTVRNKASGKTVRALQLLQLFDIFVYYCVGVFVSLIILIFEIFYFNLRKRINQNYANL